MFLQQIIYIKLGQEIDINYYLQFKAPTVLYLNSSRISSSIIIPDENPRTMQWMDSRASFTTFPSESDRKVFVKDNIFAATLQKTRNYKPFFFFWSFF